MGLASFDPYSHGAQRFAHAWVPHLERWKMRAGDGHSYVEDDGHVVQAGDTIEVGAPEGKQLIDFGYELLSVRRVRARG